MSEYKNKAEELVFKESVKDVLKQNFQSPFNTPQQNQEINDVVEQADLAADMVEEAAKVLGVDLNKFVSQLFNL